MDCRHPISETGILHRGWAQKPARRGSSWDTSSPVKGNTCSLELLGVRDSKRLLEANLHIPRTNETEALVEKPVDWSPPQDLAVACLKSAHTSESADVFTAAG